MTQENKHTPGEWKYEKAVFEDVYWIKPFIMPQGRSLPIAKVTRLEDAELIAAAPALKKRVAELEETLKIVRSLLNPVLFGKFGKDEQIRFEIDIALNPQEQP